MGENCVEVAISEWKMRDVCRFKFDVQPLLPGLLTSFGELRLLNIDADYPPGSNLPGQTKRDAAGAAACVQHSPAGQQLRQKKSRMFFCCTLFHKAQDGDTVPRCVAPFLHFGPPYLYRLSFPSPHRGRAAPMLTSLRSKFTAMPT